jgi:hypothetical protein
MPPQDFAPAAPEPQPPTAPLAPTTLREQAAALGYDTSNYQDDAALLRGLTDSAAQQAQQAPYAQLGYQMAPYADKVPEFLQAQGQPAPAPEPEPQGFDAEQHFSGLWNRPDYDPTWDRMVQMDSDTGTYVGINPQVPLEVVQGVNKYADWMRGNQRTFFEENPYRTMYDAIREPLLNDMRQEMETAQQSQQQNQNIADFEQQNAQYLWQHDAGNQPVYDQMTGQPQMTPYGQRFYQNVDYYTQNGITDPQVLVHEAAKSAHYDLLTAQQAQQQQDQQQQAQQQQQQQQPPPTPQESFLDQALANSQHAPSAYSAASSPTPAPDPRSNGDMDDFFSKAAAANGGLSS